MNIAGLHVHAFSPRLISSLFTFLNQDLEASFNPCMQHFNFYLMLEDKINLGVLKKHILLINKLEEMSIVFKIDSLQVAVTISILKLCQLKVSKSIQNSEECHSNPLEKDLTFTTFSSYFLGDDPLTTDCLLNQKLKLLQIHHFL